MKTVNNIILRVAVALILGVVLIVWSSTVVDYLVITIGALFLIPGLISVFGYFFRDKQSSEKTFPFDSIGGALLGLALIIVPSFFVGILMYILAGLLILAGILQIRSLFIVSRQFRIRSTFYAIPIVILLAGLVILFYPFETLQTAFIFLGIICVLYALSELVNYLKFLRKAS